MQNYINYHLKKYNEMTTQDIVKLLYQNHFGPGHFIKDLETVKKYSKNINLVKEKWGEDNTVTYRCDSVTAEGEYIIAVVSTQSATVKNYFRVNLANETVIIEY